MALPDANCNIPEEACCNALYETAVHLLNVVYPDLIDCIGEPECPVQSIQPFVQHGVEPDDPLCDTLIVYIVNISTSTGSTTLAGGLALAPKYRVTYRMRLRESGWPMAYAVDEQIYAPDPAVVNAIARHSYAHGERMFRSIANAHAQRALAPGSCSVVNIGEFRPVPVGAYCVGWEIDITLDVPWNYVGTP